MDQYSEYFDSIPSNTYTAVNDTIKLTNRRLLFDFYELPIGYKGQITIYNGNKITSLTSSTSSLTPQASSIVTWNFNYNCFTLIKIYFQKLLSLVEQGMFSSFFFTIFTSLTVQL